MTKTSKNTKKDYKLTVIIGKVKRGVKTHKYEFKTNDPVKALLSIDVPKLVEGVTITLEKDGKVATRSLLSFQAKRAFNNKLNAFYLIKTMHWIFK